MMKLKSLIKGVDALEVDGSLELDISGISYDSNYTKKGDLFICIKGFAADGHDFVRAAAGKGAAAVIVEKDIGDLGITVVKVKDSRKAMPVIASNFYRKPADKLKLIGITGTNGKTTTTYMVKSILEADGKKTGLLGTIQNHIGSRVVPATRTTPESLDLQRIFREMADEDVEYAVMEVSSHSLELGRVDGLVFRSGIFTNLTQDHLDFHKTMENYRNAKKKLFYMTKKANIINIDDPSGRLIAEEVKACGTRLFTYGIENQADISAKNIEMEPWGAGFTLVTPRYSMDIEIKLPGRFNIYNALAAATAAYAEGIGRKSVKKGLERMSNVPGRSEIVYADTPYTIMIDYAHSPDGLKSILSSIRQYAKGKIITIFGCGGDRDREKRPIMGEIAGKLSDYCVITSDNPRTEEPMEIIKQIEAGIKLTDCDYICIENRRDAIKYALTVAREGDMVLLAGKGHETYQVLKEGTIHFDEREIVRELLREEI